MRALNVHAGPVALQHLRERGLKPSDVTVMAAAAGGPKGLVLLPLDAFLFGQWLPQGGHTIDLLGASIGAWRLAAACAPQPVAALERLGYDYIHERYGVEQGRFPDAATISAQFARTLHAHFGPEVDTIVQHPRWKLHILTSRGVGVLRGPGRAAMSLGLGAAVLANAVHPKGLACALERVSFSRGGCLPVWAERSGRVVPLTSDNFSQALLASCTIPFWLEAVAAPTGAPPGWYWDGGLIDYHFHWPYRRMSEGFALIPHFQPHLIPGWLDKSLPWRHGSSADLDRAIVLSPTPEWVRSLPGGKIPDRSDFKRWAHDPQQREALWSSALKASHVLAEEWAEWVEQPRIEALPLP